VGPAQRAIGRDVALTTHANLVPRLRRVELYLFPLWAFVACSRVNVTFTFTTLNRIE